MFIVRLYYCYIGNNFIPDHLKLNVRNLNLKYLIHIISLNHVEMDI